jgi:HD-GYP domain-containing protein (c-di-GMP phosphodiesterase class II)
LGPDATALNELGAALLDALERRAPGAREHAAATARYAFGVGAELGLPAAGCDLVADAARLHEVGTLYLPAELLRQSPPLPEEKRLRRDAQAEAGYRLLVGVGAPAEVCEWIRLQGERFDGGGRNRLAADAIPIESRIIAAACAYDSVRRRASPAPALAELRGAAGSALDPDVVAALSAVVTRVAPGP